MWTLFVAAVVLGAAVMLWNQALRWLNEPSAWKVWAGYLTIAGMLSLIWGGGRWLVRRRGMHWMVAAAAIGLSGCAYKTVPPGHVGIRVEMTGADRGVQNIPLQTGRIWYNPVNETVLEYPTFVQRAIWTRSSTEGSPHNDEISFQSKEGLHFTADMAVSYQLLRDKVPYFYVQFRSDNIAAFTHGYLRDAVRNAVGKLANGYSAEEINGSKQGEISEKAMAMVSKSLSQIGVDFVQMGFTSPPRPPDEVAYAIKSKIAAIQKAEQAENERRQAIAEGEKTVALAQAQARANDAINRSVTPQLMQWRQLEILNAKWDGKFPQVQGGNAAPMLMLQPRQ